MDLKVKDVAELLQVSEATIHRWLDEGKIPAYRLKAQVRFSRTEIEAWMLQQRLEEEERSSEGALGTNQFSLYRAIHKGGVLSDVAGSTKEEVIRNSMNQVASKFNLDAEVLTDLLLDREQLMPTALGHGVAVPHTRDFLLGSPFDLVVVVYPKKPLEYGSLDGLPVHTLLFLFACKDTRHLHLLAKIAHLCNEPEKVELLKSKPESAQLLPLIKKWESQLSSSSSSAERPGD